MTILHLLGSPYDGGAETYFISLLDALGRRGVRQAAAIHRNEGRERALQAQGVPTLVLPFKRPFDLVTRPRAGAFAREVKASLLLAWMGRAASLCPDGPWPKIGRLGGYYDLKYYRRLDYLVANTADIADYIVRRGWPPSRVSYIPNFATPDDSLPIPRATFDTPEGVPLLLGLGRLHSDKAHDITLRALKAIPGAWLWIAGSGPLEAKLKARAAHLGVTDRVRFLGWRDDAGALYRAADLCLFPSRIEPLGNVVIQAWAYGLPVIAAASAGPARLIRDGRDGMVVPIDDPDALAEAARTLLGDAAARTRLREAGFKRVAEDFGEEAVAAAWRKLFAAHGAA